MVVHLDRGGERGGVVLADGDLHLAKVEYCHAVYCDVTDSGSVRGGRGEEGGTARYAVVGICGT